MSTAIETTKDLNLTLAPTSTQTPINKRLRDVLQNSFIGNATKAPRLDSPTKLITSIDKRFDKFADQIENMIDTKFREYREELLTDLDRRYELLRNELQIVNERVTLLETVASEVNCLRDEINTLKNRIRKQENYPISNELRLNEIPYSENEDLMNIFCNICNTIDTSVPAIKSIYRLQNQNNKQKNKSKDAVIIVKMWSMYDKNFFLKSLADYRKLHKGFFFCLRDIGFNSDNKFFVNENLTQTNFNILRTAIRFKKRKLISSAFSLRGSVYIKKEVNGNLVLIDEIQRLYQLFPGSAEQDNVHPNVPDISNISNIQN